MLETYNQGAEFENAVDQAARVLDNRRYENSRGYNQAEVEPLAMAVIAMGEKLQNLKLAYSDEVRSIESDLVGALKDELEVPRSTSRSWAAALRAVGALRARDTKLAELEDKLHAALAKTEQLREELEYARRVARERD